MIFETHAHYDDEAFDEDREGLLQGMAEHGIGTIIKIEGTGENTKATVTFRNVGTKQLLLKFAKFKIL